MPTATKDRCTDAPRRSTPHRAARAVPRWAAWLGALVLAACGSPARLTIDLKTDYVAGAEFSTVRAELSTTPFVGTAPSGTTLATPTRETQRFIDGVRVAEFPGLARGRFWARISLVSADGTVVAQRVTDVQIDGPYALTSVISRDCGGVTCPRAGDDPSLISCNGGTCVDPRCTPDAPEYCGEGECVGDADCVAEGACARAVCEGGACLFVPDDARCGATARCTAAFTCESLVPDAGSPADDAGPPCPARESACGDGVDEDCDRLVDCADPDCGGTACDDGQPCTSGDVCDTTAGACVGAAVSCVSDACADRVCNGTAACTVTLHPGVACPDDGNPCTTDVCNGAGACTHPALPGLSPCPDDGNFCTNDVCDASARCVHPLWDGRHCPFGGVCCAGVCVDNTTDEANCGTCGIRCPSGRTCTAGACNCAGNSECIGAGYGPLASCFMNRCQCVCTGNPNDRVECFGQCAGFGTCAQVADLNYCYYP